MRKELLVLIVGSLIVVASISVYFVTRPRAGCYLAGALVATPTRFSFDLKKALQFYINLSTPLGLEAEYPGSKTVWLADDQALDYYSLLKIYNATGDSRALTIAAQINRSASAWGGLYAYWNPAFEAFGCYPTNTDVLWGRDVTVNPSVSGYVVRATVFSWNPTYSYLLSADQLAYRALLSLNQRDYHAAETNFALLSLIWISSGGQGFADAGFYLLGNLYQSYKLALYIISWNQLLNNPTTRSFATGYMPIVNAVSSLMSKLQSSGGGVWTGYKFSGGTMLYGEGISLANGETTSLFVLADS